DQGGDVASQARRELEAVSARPGVDEDPRRDLPDHRLPVRADVVEAGPPTVWLGGFQRRRAPDHGLAELPAFVLAQALVERVGISLRLLVQRTDQEQVRSLG